MTGPVDPTRYAFEYPDGEGTLSQDQAVLIDEVIDDPDAPAFDFAVAKGLGMTVVDDLDWAHHRVTLEVLRIRRVDLHAIRPGISLDYSNDPVGLDD